MVQITVLFHTFPPLMIFYVGLTKMETAAKTAPRVPKLGFKGGLAPQLSAWGTLTMSGAGVVCHMENKLYKKQIPHTIITKCPHRILPMYFCL